MSPIAQAMARAFGMLPAAPAELKQSRVAQLTSLQWQGQAVWTPRDYAALAKEGYQQNAIVYRSVRMICEAAASVPLIVENGGQISTDHPLLDLLAAPNAAQCGVEFFERIYGFMLVAGNAYIEAVAPADTIDELHVLRPDRMKAVPGGDGWPDAYDYTVDGRVHRFDQDRSGGVRPILHLAFFHPLNDLYGFSPIEAAAVAIDLHNAAGQWNKSLLDNSARPSGALVYQSSDGNLTSEQYERLKSDLELSFQGTRNAGRPLLLEGGLDWKSMGFSPKDMDFIEAKHVAAREIALAFGVPPMLLGIPGDNTYSNFQEANRTLWRQTVLPLVERVCKSLSAWLAPAFGNDSVLRPDLERLVALSAERDGLWQRVRDADFLTVNEKRAAIGYGPVEGGDAEPTIGAA